MDSMPIKNSVSSVIQVYIKCFWELIPIREIFSGGIFYVDNMQVELTGPGLSHPIGKTRYWRELIFILRIAILLFFISHIVTYERTYRAA